MGISAVRVHRGARAAEAALLAEVAELAGPIRVAARPGEPIGALAHLLASPVRVVVPSQSLREHVAARIARELGGACAGLVVQTLRGLAFEIVGRAGETARGGHVLFPIVVRQLAREEAVLRASLDDLDDGYAAVAGSVADLLDAGYEPALEEGLLDCLAELSGARGERARALVRVAGGVVARLAEHGLEHRAGLHRRAREALEADPGRLPARAILIHGYADATGVQLELLRALCTLAGAQVLVDHPDDPAEPGLCDPASAFTDRLAGHLSAARPEPAEAPELRAPEIELFRAAGAHAEAREVAERVRNQIAAGTAPEGIAIVARDLDPYRLPLQIHLGRLAVPFSGGRGSFGSAGRRIRALLDLLRDEAETSGDRWLDAADLFAPETLRDLRLALHGIGLGRVRDVAATDASRVGDERGYPLPVRRGLVSVPSAEAEGAAEVEGEVAAAPVRAVRRRLSREALAHATERAEQLCADLAALRRAENLGEILDSVRRLLARPLGWCPATAGFAETHAALASLEEELGRTVRLSFGEARLLFESALAEAGREPLGGAGGGVQLLSVVEARARTFERLFVLGMNRDLFPRPVAEDPLLPDADRLRLEAVLPDIPVKRRGFAEERYLFAQLCSAAERVVLSWQAVSDDGKERLASPLIERLLAGRTEAELSLAVAVHERRDSGALRPAHEHAVEAALRGDTERLEALLAISLAGGHPGAEPRERARARVAAIRELDEAGRRGGDLGPYFGFVGAPVDATDPRCAALYVTRLEGLSRCGWQTFLERVLRIEPVPDALEALPRIDRRMIGQVLHAALEAIAVAAGVPARVSLAEALALGPHDVAWPEGAALDAIVLAAADAVAREEGIALPGFARVLDRRVRPFLERVREVDWPAGVLRGVLGVEIEGAIEIAGASGRERQLFFRADRVDRSAEALSLTDYKAGAHFSAAVDTERRRDALRKRIASGIQIQAAAYARSGGGRAAGRYLYALPDLDVQRAECSIEPGDAEAQERFEEAARVLAAVWETGSLTPRLLNSDLSESGTSCEFCDMRPACLQGDSGARRRLARWIEAQADPLAAPLGGAEAALVEAWRLAVGGAP